MWRVLLGAVGVALLVTAAYGVGLRVERGRWDAALVATQHRADSLAQVVTLRTQRIRRDSAHVTAALTRWERFADSVRRAPPVRVVVVGHTDTLPGRVDTVAVPPSAPLVDLADQTIREIDDARRQCLSVLDTCTVALQAATDRAEQAEARAARSESSAHRASRWRAVERGVCAASLAGNWLQFRLGRS